MNRKGSDGQASLLSLPDLFFEQSLVAKWLEVPDPESWRCCLISGVWVQTPLWPEFFRITPGLIKYIYTFRVQVKNTWLTTNGHSLTDIIADFTYRKGSDGHASLLLLPDLFFMSSPRWRSG